MDRTGVIETLKARIEEVVNLDPAAVKYEYIRVFGDNGNVEQGNSELRIAIMHSAIDDAFATE